MNIKSNEATLKNCVNERPDFPLGKVCGRLKRFAVENGCDGGLRTKGIYKKNTEDLPLVTYITCVKNSVKTISRCMESVFTQNYFNIEYIIIDGASTDGTLEIIKENEDKIDYFISQADKSAVEAVNKAISLASGQFIGIINSDDLLMPNAAKIIIMHYKKNGSKLINGGFSKIKRDGTVTHPACTPRFQIPFNTTTNSFLYPSFYASREAFEFCGKFDESYTIINDYVWALSCLEKGVRFDLINDTLTLFSDNGASSTNLKKFYIENIRHTRQVFPFLSQSQAKLYITLFSKAKVAPVNFSSFVKISSLFTKNIQFRVATYRTLLFVYVTKLFEIIEQVDENLISFQDIYDSLLNNLNNNLARGESADASQDDFAKIYKQKKLYESMFIKYKLISTSSFKNKIFQIISFALIKSVTWNVFFLTIILRIRRDYKESKTKEEKN